MFAKTYSTERGYQRYMRHCEPAFTKADSRVQEKYVGSVNLRRFAAHRIPLSNKKLAEKYGIPEFDFD